MWRILLITMVTMVGCAKSGSSSSSSSTSKSLFSKWSDSTTGSSVDLTGGSLGTSVSRWTLLGGGQCDCLLTMTQSSNAVSSIGGTYSLASCTFVSTSATSDPGCNALNQTGSFDYYEYTEKLLICRTSVTPCYTYY